MDIMGYYGVFWWVENLDVRRSYRALENHLYRVVVLTDQALGEREPPRSTDRRQAAADEHRNNNGEEGDGGGGGGGEEGGGGGDDAAGSDSVEGDVRRPGTGAKVSAAYKLRP